MNSPEDDELLDVHAAEFTHAAANIASQAQVATDKVAATLSSPEAGGIAVRGGALRVRARELIHGDPRTQN